MLQYSRGIIPIHVKAIRIHQPLLFTSCKRRIKTIIAGNSVIKLVIILIGKIPYYITITLNRNPSTNKVIKLNKYKNN